VNQIILYQTDSYLREFEAKVVEINRDDNSVALDKTAFYPGGGGQPCDTGVIIINGSQVNITKVKRQGELIFHKLDGEPPETGVTVKGVLNWDRRYQLMRTHTAFHILCGVIWRDYQASVTGGNMEPLKGRMDFEFETMRQELVKEIEKNVNAEVANARDVIIKILPREEAFQIPDLIRTRINLLPEGITEVRTVEIAGLDLQADGGTHVANTAEVGMVRVTDYKSKGRINKRIHLELE
jgi:misacylated tRNA(Ala) deacylase